MVPILEGLVAANPDEAEALYALYEVYRAASQPKLAFAALSQAVHAQVDGQKKTRWEEELSALDYIHDSSHPLQRKEKNHEK